MVLEVVAMGRGGQVEVLLHRARVDSLPEVRSLIFELILRVSLGYFSA